MAVDPRITNPLMWSLLPIGIHRLALVRKNSTMVQRITNPTHLGYLETNERLEVKPVVHVGNLWLGPIAPSIEYESFEDMLEEWEVD